MDLFLFPILIITDLHQGVKNGMFMKTAKRLCPELVVVGYEFSKYEEVSKQIYRIFFKVRDHC
jgi:DNA repair protein REV1